MPTKNIIQRKHILSILGALLICVVFLESTNILQAAAPTVITMPAVDITKTGATLTGIITSDGGLNVTDTGFEFGLTSGYGQSISGEEEYQQTAEFGSAGSGDTQFDSPNGIDIDSTGNIYVLDTGNDRLKKYNSSHVFQYNVTSADLPGDNGFNSPRDVTVLGNDTVVVFDTFSGPGNTGAFLFIDSSGNFVDCYGLGTSCSYFQNFGSFVKGLAASGTDSLYYTWFQIGGSHGLTGLDASHNTIYDIASFSATNIEGGLSSPLGVYVDGSGNVFVTETGNSRVQKFDALEAFVFQIGRSDETSGSASGEFSSPTDVALDSDGNIFVVDSGNNRVQKFNGSGTFVSKFGTSGSGSNQMASPLGVAIDASDDIYITDQGNSRIVKYELGFTADLSVVLPALTCGTTYHYRAFATNSDGTSYGADQSFTTLACDIPVVHTLGFGSLTDTSVVLEGSHEDVGSVTVTTRGFEYGLSTSYGSTTSESGNLFLNEFGTTGGGGVDGEFVLLQGIGTDADGNVYTTDQFEDRVQKFSSDGTFLLDFGSSGSGLGQFSGAYSARVGPNGKVFLADSNNGRIQTFDADGTNPSEFASGATLTFPTDVAFDSGGNVYISDYASNQVLKYDPTGATELLAVTVGAGSLALSNPLSVGVDSLGNIYVSDTGSATVQKFDASGVYVDSIGGTGSDNGEFGISPGYIAIDENDFIYVSDGTNNRIQKFNTSLVYQSSFGSSGTDDGQFSGPTGVAIGQDGDIFVADQNNARVQRFNELFDASISGLTCSTTYHYRAYAENPDGIGDGDDATFTTSACPPSTGGGGGGTSGTHFICTDPLALNYTPPGGDGRPNANICNYPEDDDGDELACDGALFLSRPVRYGVPNNPEDVKLLERYLNTYEFAGVPVDGVYAFDDYAAVVRWQEKYASEILKPWGLTKGTGYVFITSLRKIQKVHDTGCAETEKLKKDFCYIYDQKLKKGDRIPLVKFAQRALKAAGTFSGNIDGVFGPVTETSVKNFQVQNGLAGDGVIGTTTGQKLEDVTCNI